MYINEVDNVYNIDIDNIDNIYKLTQVRLELARLLKIRSKFLCFDITCVFYVTFCMILFSTLLFEKPVHFLSANIFKRDDDILCNL